MPQHKQKYTQHRECQAQFKRNTTSHADPGGLAFFLYWILPPVH
jgi:hypothetical protein